VKKPIKRPTKQIYQNYTQEDFEVWKILFNRQFKSLKGIVADEFLFGLKDLAFNSEKIPNFSEINVRLKKHTGWSVKTVPNISPPREFFSYLAKKKFTTTCWLRSMSQIDYLEEPDMFHDIFAHVPLLSNKDYTSFFEEIGQIANEIINDPLRLRMLQRLYWFTIEFGLILSGDTYKIYGAGIISSKGESDNVFSKKSKKLSFDVKKIMNHSFRTDIIQDTYYVIDSFEQLTQSVNEIRKQLKVPRSANS
tara:strand:+ start:180 stop:929 length:750 start_codon:yes stop_codon:yes gene_type:complete